MLSIADYLSQFPNLEEFEYLNWLSVLIIGPAPCYRLGKVFLERLREQNKTSLRLCRLCE